MNVRNLIAATAFSAAVLASGAGFAADGQQGAPTGFSAQLSDTKGALHTSNSAAVGREERNEAVKYVAMAESLWNNGSDAKAQQFLNFARGKLGLQVQPADVSLVEHVSEHSTSLR